MKLFDPAMVALQNAIKRSAAMQANIARDIANSSTPGYAAIALRYLTRDDCEL